MRYLEAVAPGNFSPKGAMNTRVARMAAAKKAAQPLHDFLGLNFDEGEHVTSFTIGLDSPDVVRQK